MITSARRQLPQVPPSARASAQPGELTGAGIPWGALADTLPQSQASVTPQAPAGLPSAPPSAKNTNPFSKDNRQQTLLSIGQAFLSSPDFFQGLGNAAGAVNGRITDLKELAERKPKVSYGGPDGRFEITEGPDGSRSIREVPEFAQVLADKAAEKNAPATKDLVDMRARAIRAISQLPEEERASAYAGLMNHPDMYGGVDVSGMPPGWDPTYASVMGNMGTTVAQAQNQDYRERALQVRTAQGNQRIQQAQQRLDAPPKRRARAAVTSAPSGFILD